MTYLRAHLPFLNLPVIRNITKAFIEFIIQILVDKTELGAYFIYSDMLTSEQAKKFGEAAKKNQEIQESGTDEEKRLAQLELINRARDLIRLNH